MIFLTAGSLALGATAGMMLEQRFGVVVVQWLRHHLAQLRGPRPPL